MADTAAKEAAQQAAIRYRPRDADAAQPLTAQFPTSSIVPAIEARPSQQYILVATCRQRLRAAAAVQWKQAWEINPHGSHLRRIFTEPAKTLLDLHAGLRRAASSAVIQLQTGKVALAGYLGTFGPMESTDCPCGLGRQDSEHILTRCPTHERLRNEVLWHKARETDYKRILSQASLVKKAAQFIIGTRLLGQFRSLPLTYRVGVADP
jgi:hypothetical protein